MNRIGLGAWLGTLSCDAGNFCNRVELNGSPIPLVRVTHAEAATSKIQLAAFSSILANPGNGCSSNRHESGIASIVLMFDSLKLTRGCHQAMFGRHRRCLVTSAFCQSCSNSESKRWTRWRSAVTMKFSSLFRAERVSCNCRLTVSCCQRSRIYDACGSRFDRSGRGFLHVQADKCLI